MRIAANMGGRDGAAVGGLGAVGGVDHVERGAAVGEDDRQHGGEDGVPGELGDARAGAGDHAGAGLLEGRYVGGAGYERPHVVEVHVREVVDREADGEREAVAADCLASGVKRLKI